MLIFQWLDGPVINNSQVDLEIGLIFVILLA